MANSTRISVHDAIRAARTIRKMTLAGAQNLNEMAKVDPDVEKLRGHVQRRQVRLLDLITTPDDNYERWSQLMALPVNMPGRMNGKNPGRSTRIEHLRAVLPQFIDLNPETGELTSTRRKALTPMTTKVHVSAEGTTIEPLAGTVGTINGGSNGVGTGEQPDTTPDRAYLLEVEDKKAETQPAHTTPVPMDSFERLVTAMYKVDQNGTLDAILVTVPAAALVSRMLDAVRAMEEQAASQADIISKLEQNVNGLEQEISQLIDRANNLQVTANNLKAENNRLYGEKLDLTHELEAVKVSAGDSQGTAKRTWLNHIKGK